MNTRHSSSDPLLRSLTEDTANLPVRAASEARQRIARRRRNRQRTALLASVTLVGFITWSTLPSFPKSIPGTPEPGQTAEHHAVKPSTLQTLPTGLDAEQAAFVKQAGDVPLLLVRNSSGQVTRIHLIER